MDVNFANGQVFCVLFGHILSPDALYMQPNFLILKVLKSFKNVQLKFCQGFLLRGSQKVCSLLSVRVVTFLPTRRANLEARLPAQTWPGL